MNKSNCMSGSKSKAMVKCEHCSSRVRTDRLGRHINRVHRTSGRPTGRDGMIRATPHFILAGANSINSFDFGDRHGVRTVRSAKPEMKQGSRKCRFCGNHSIPGSDVCYDC